MKIAVISDKKQTVKGYKTVCFSSDTLVSEAIWLEYDVAILLSPFNERALISWTGHPHLRCCNSVNEAIKEIELFENNIETEKKFLVKYPDFEKLKIYKPYKSDIEQVYLDYDMGTRRIRKRTFGNQTIYVDTVKIRISNSSSREYESVITKDEYLELLKIADKTKKPIVKSRYCFMYDNRYLELDVYDFWNDKAVIEAELSDERDEVKLPPELELIKDVTEDYNYKNSQLARIDYEDC